MNTVVCKFCRGAIAALVIAATGVVGVASAASISEFTPIDIMETVRQSEVESPFTFSTTGENDGSHSEQLFDGDLTADGSKSADQNGRAIFTISKGPSITVSFNPAVFGNRHVFLRQYGFRMWHKAAAAGWNVANRMPGTWTVHVSGKETPSSEDDWTLVDSRERPISYSNVDNSYYSADFTADALVPTRHVRFTFTQGNPAGDYVSLGEITMSGLLGPDDEDARDVAFYGTEIQSVNGDGSVDASVSILPAGQAVDPYDLFVECRTGDHADTNWLARATTVTGLYETKVTGLRLGADYTLRFGAIAANAVSAGDAANFMSTDDIIPSRLPAGYTELEYIESTDTGNQCIDCGFAPTGRFGFDLDFIGYNAFQRGAYYDKGDRDAGYGCYLTASANLVLSSSTGGGGGYTTGMFLYNGAKNAGLVRNERMRFLVGGGKYTTIVGTTTNSTSFTSSNLNGPNLFLAACCDGAGTTNQYGVMRIYSLKTYNDGVSPSELTHEFVPAKRKSDNAIGVYDVVAYAWRPNGSATPFLAGPAVQSSDRLNFSSVSRTGRALSATLIRGWTGAADVYAAWGATYAGIDAANWEHTQRIGAFAENDSSVQVTTPDLGRATIYVRFYTADDKWSETIYLPDQPAKSSGFIYIVR